MRVGNDEIEFKVTSEHRAGGLVAAEVTMPPGGGPPALHRHAPSELYRVQAGEFAVYLEDGDGEIERIVAGPGETVAIAADREHTVRNESEAPATAFVAYAPGAEMEAFSRAAARLAEVGSPSVARVLALAAEHGIEITRPLEPVA